MSTFNLPPKILIEYALNYDKNLENFSFRTRGGEFLPLVMGYNRVIHSPNVGFLDYTFPSAESMYEVADWCKKNGYYFSFIDQPYAVPDPPRLLGVKRILPIFDSFEEYLRGFKSESRRKIKKYLAFYSFSFEMVHDFDDATLFPQFVELHHQCFTDPKESWMTSLPEIELTNLYLETLALTGKLHMGVLKLDKKLCAIVILAQHDLDFTILFFVKSPSIENAGNVALARTLSAVMEPSWKNFTKPGGLISFMADEFGEMDWKEERWHFFPVYLSSYEYLLNDKEWDFCYKGMIDKSSYDQCAKCKGLCCALGNEYEFSGFLPGEKEWRNLPDWKCPEGPCKDRPILCMLFPFRLALRPRNILQVWRLTGGDTFDYLQKQDCVIPDDVLIARAKDLMPVFSKLVRFEDCRLDLLYHKARLIHEGSLVE